MLLGKRRWRERKLHKIRGGRMYRGKRKEHCERKLEEEERDIWSEIKIERKMEGRSRETDIWCLKFATSLH